jgi:hypothetical protein
MDHRELDQARSHLILSLIRAGVTGDETFGDLLDDIDAYVRLCLLQPRGVGDPGGPPFGARPPRPPYPPNR